MDETKHIRVKKDRNTSSAHSVASNTLSPQIVQKKAIGSQLYQRAHNDARSLSPGEVLLLQRTLGNRAVGQLARDTSQERPVWSNASQSERGQNKKNNTRMPDTLKTGMESLSGVSMDDVQVHYNSSKPAQLQAYAYTQGTDIHLGPGQEEHLTHEAWHVVQQKQGRVKPTMQMQGVAINDDQALEHEADQVAKQELPYQIHHESGHRQNIDTLNNVIQAKWIHDPRSPFLIWDRILNGLRWFYIIEAKEYFFIIEDDELRPTLEKLEGEKNARTRDKWIHEGFLEQQWKESDREIIPFHAHELEAVKIANMEHEIPRGFLEEEAMAFFESGEAGNVDELLEEFAVQRDLLETEIKPALQKNRKIAKTTLDKISKNWVKLIGFTELSNNDRIKLAKDNLDIVMIDLRDILENRIGLMLWEIEKNFGEIAYTESLNATTNLMKRFLSPSSGASKTDALVKGFEVYNQLFLRIEQLHFRRTSPIVANYELPEFGSLERQIRTLEHIQLGTQMRDVEIDFDVLARRTGANKDPSIKHIHEVDLAFVRVFQGVTEAYANPKEGPSGGLSFQGGGGVGEKVFAVGHKGAVDFREDTKKTEERFYALIFPKGFVAYFGYNLMKLGKSGASAREPNEEEFSAHKMPEMNNDPEIIIPGNKMFFIRGETSTAELGQVDIHFGWRDMIVNGKRLNHADFFRLYALAVIEFTRSGSIIKIQILKEL